MEAWEEEGRRKERETGKTGETREGGGKVKVKVKGKVEVGRRE
jgi:hypothetical protein